ncbi:MAG: N-acetyltransferase [Caldilineaceae bacterium]|nr:N-acetyltransferase [Caldilineaceae bacterium]
MVIVLTDMMMIHPTAEVSPQASIGHDTQIWNHTQIRERAVVGSQCVVGRDVYIDVDVHIGDRVKIQNSALLYRGVTIADGVFIGPRVCFTNDRYPRAITPSGTLKTTDDWTQGEIFVEYGASIGAGAIIVTGVTIGRFAMVAAGAVVTRDVPPHGLVMGVPAQLVNHVCACGQPLPCNDTNRLSDLANVVAADPPQPRRTAYTHAGYGNQGSVKYLCDVCDTLWEMAM